MSVNALILAGSRPGAIDPVAQAEGIAHKALVDLGGHTMLARVHGALIDAGMVRILVSANDPQVITEAERLGAEILPPALGPSESVALAFAEVGAPMLVTTADHGLLQGEWVRQFVEDSPPGADVTVCLAKREKIEAAVPETKRTWMRFADGDWSGCNLFLLASPTAQKAIATWHEVEADRKRPWRIARRLGIGTLWNYWRGKLTLSEILALLGAKIGIDAALVEAGDGLAAVDVDKPEDLELVRKILARQSAS